MSDDWFLSRYRQMKIVLGSSDWDMCLDANVKMAAILQGKGIPNWLDIYGDNSKHDWRCGSGWPGSIFKARVRSFAVRFSAAAAAAAETSGGIRKRTTNSE